MSIIIKLKHFTKLKKNLFFKNLIVSPNLKRKKQKRPPGEFQTHQLRITTYQFKKIYVYIYIYINKSTARLESHRN